MIAHIQGKLGEIWDKSCIVMTSGGVGYRLALPAHTLSSLPPQGEDVAFYTSLVVREDALELFGFDTFEERQTFEILRAINKIGARTALAILSSFRPEELQQIVGDENVTALTRVPGIGQKTAQHVFVELKYKLAAMRKTTIVPCAAGANVYGDVMAALANLGYTEEECANMVRTIVQSEPDIDVGSAIRLALKEMSGRRTQ